MPCIGVFMFVAWQLHTKCKISYTLCNEMLTNNPDGGYFSVLVLRSISQNYTACSIILSPYLTTYSFICFFVFTLACQFGKIYPTTSLTHESCFFYQIFKDVLNVENEVDVLSSESVLFYSD